METNHQLLNPVTSHYKIHLKYIFLMSFFRI